ncbi:MAG: 2-keto-4-pentenoate hydratase [Alphaproteobacteria bacterium]|nr:2-keto-4-pentenoate hydratase [Alphaproteobacteria bacterium]
MTQDDIAYAARTLIEARRSGAQVSPPFALPDRAAVFAIQDEVARLSGGIGGWKVGASGRGAEPNPAPLLAGTVRRSPAAFDGRTLHMIGIEIEIAFRVGHDVPSRTTPVPTEEALKGIDAAFVAMEVCDTRIANYRNAHPSWLLADNQSNHALILGTPLTRWRDIEWDGLTVRLEIDGALHTERRGGFAAGDPLWLVGWMIDHAARHRGGVRAGSIVTTGSWIGLPFFPPGVQARGTFDGLGEVEARF